MTRYKCIIAYDGTDYVGWQIQPHEIAVTTVLQNTFNKVFGKTIKVTGASRTDAGVHAMGQVASFATDLELYPEKMQRAWNNSLPESIAINSLEVVPDDYRPRCNVVQKTYWYHFFVDRPSPFIARYGYYHHYKTDIEKLKKALQVFVGIHDFCSFASDKRKNTVRRIDSISLEYLKKFNAYRIEIKGRSFLHFMIRRIVGACLKVARDEALSIDVLKKVLDEKNPNQWLPKAPAKGLMLFSIEYKK